MGLMKTYGYYLILHIFGLTGLIAAGVLAMLHGLWFCTIICGLLLVGICYSLVPACTAYKSGRLKPCTGS